MTTTDAEANVAPEVRLFLARVRRELADLDPEVLSDITDGLEADFTELVEERGPDALGDPAEYANELRAAAGIPVGVKAPRGFAERVDGLLDAGHDRFDKAVAKLGELLRTDLGPVVAWLRPLWWIVRAWAAAWLVSAVFGWSMSSARRSCSSSSRWRSACSSAPAASGPVVSGGPQPGSCSWA